MFIKRERYLAKIRPFYDADLIKVLTGVRRCGKSVLLGQIEEELRSGGYDEGHIIKVNFEDLRFEKIRNAERLNQYVIDRIKDDGKYLIFLHLLGQLSIVPFLLRAAILSCFQGKWQPCWLADA